jgi:uncharacterized protein (DUF779 family)
MNALPRVTATEATVELLRQLKARHGELIFFQSGGCCDGSAPMCYPAGDFTLGDTDVHLGKSMGCRSTSAPTSSNTGSTRN